MSNFFTRRGRGEANPLPVTESAADTASSRPADDVVDPAGVALLELDDQRGFAQRMAEGVSLRLAAKPNRRSFLAGTATVGAAIVVNPVRYMMRPGSAEEAVCGPANECSEGWTVFCCTINEGRNTCPPGTVAAGWWKADLSPFCDGAARYYLDCNALCHDGCGCGPGGICGPNCHDWTCGCGEGTCDRRRIACNNFRYGQCHQELACVGPVVCRVVSCVPPWQWDPTCTSEVATANATRYHHAPCLDDTATVYGSVAALGAATDHGSPADDLSAPIVGIEASATGGGYWLVTAAGEILAFGDAANFGSIGGLPLNQPVVDIAALPDSSGYWLVAADGGVFSYGSALFQGSTGDLVLNQPIVGAASTPTGDGYWMVARDGGVFTFGDAKFEGSTGGLELVQPVVVIAPTVSGQGYWMVARDGGVFAFGDAEFRGSLGGTPLAAPIVGIAATPSGGGYWMVSAQGEIFTFGDAVNHGGVAIDAFSEAVDIDSTPFGDGYWVASNEDRS